MASSKQAPKKSASPSTEGEVLAFATGLTEDAHPGGLVRNMTIERVEEPDESLPKEEQVAQRLAEREDHITFKVIADLVKPADFINIAFSIR